MKSFSRSLMTTGFILSAFVCFSSRAETPAVPTVSFAFEETVTLAQAITPGKTSMGDRNIVPITGGKFEGPGDGNGIKGTIIPGGWDWQLGRSDGCLWIKADYMLKTDDGVIINVLNQGPICRPAEGSRGAPTRSVATFEPPLGKYAWLGQSAFIGTLEPVKLDSGPAVRIRFYRVQ